MEQTIPPRAYLASSRPATSTGAGTVTENGAGMDSKNPMLGMNQSRQNLALHEYNRCADKYGLQPLLFGQLGSGDQYGHADQSDPGSHESDRRNWFARTFGKTSMPSPRRSSRHSIGSRSEQSSRHRRSDSNSDQTTLPQLVQSLQASQASQSSQASHSSKSDTADTLKNHTLETLVRICGKSYLYLPSEHATRSLMLPTCFRAAAQHLVQHGPEARGIFRISGSMRVVNELYDYYCINIDDDEDISATVRAPNLPFHIKCSVHDVASMFKRLLSGLPGGILGYLGLFAALVDILKLEAEPHRGQSKGGDSLQDPRRARLIALAVGSVPSALQRELICAVFGLLSLIGSAAELQPAVPDPGTPGSSLPHSEKMGFAALGIIFGPLLIGGNLSSYYLSGSSSGSSLTSPPTTSQLETPSPRSKTEKRRKSMASDRHAPSALPSALDKIFLANDVAQMVISNWQDAVSQMKQIGIMRKESMLQQAKQSRPESLPRVLRPTKSDTFAGLNMSTLSSQASHGHESNLRKARSASNNRKQTDNGDPVPSETSHTTSAAGKQPPHNLPSQRPSDMTFEEFAARKKLRSQGSSMSIASDSTYSAITPQPVRPLSPQLEDPFFVSDPTATSTRFGAAKITKQRRISGGRSSLFTDKSTLPSQSSPKIARKAVPSPCEGQASQRKRSGTKSSPWNVSLSPTKTRGTTHSGMEQASKGRPLPTPTTPKRTNCQATDTKTCQSEPAGRVGVGATPQSRTVALLAKMINTGPHDKSAPLAPPAPLAPETPTRKSKLRDSLHGGGSRGGNLEKSLHRLGHLSMRPEKGLEQSPPLPVSRKQTKQPVTPQRCSVAPTRSYDERAGAQSKGRLLPDVQAGHAVGTAAVPVRTSPLSEIKNDARGVAKSQHKAAGETGTTREESPGKLEAKSPAIGKSVRAMAALFDGTPWACSAEATTEGRAHTLRSPLPPKESALTEHTDNAPAAKLAGFVTPTRPLSIQSRGALDEKNAQKKQSPSQQQASHGRRRLQFSKSEDRGASLAKERQHVTDANKDAARSVDRKPVAAFARQKHTSQPPLRDARTKQLPDPQSPSLLQKALAKEVLPNGHSAGPANPRSTKELASLLPSSDEKTSTKKLQQVLDCKTVECERWQVRAEAAERRVAELELLLSLSGVSGKADCPKSGAPIAGEDNRQSWAWQDLLPEPTLIEGPGEKGGTHTGVRGTGTVEHRPDSANGL